MAALASLEESLINHHLSSLIYHHSEAQIRPFVAFVTFCKKPLTFASLADETKGGDGMESALREILFLAFKRSARSSSLPGHLKKMS
jgi:hypothetical protein